MSNDIKELIDRLRTDSLDATKASLSIMDLCMEAAEALENLDAQLDVCIQGGYRQNAGKRDIAIGPDQMGSRDANCDGF